MGGREAALLLGLKTPISAVTVVTLLLLLVVSTALQWSLMGTAGQEGGRDLQ
jgi:hypothetical protein